MQRKTASDFPPEVLKLFDGYVHGFINRREFLDRAGKYAVGGATAAVMLESLRPEFRAGQQIAKDDARIKTEYLTYTSPQGSGTMQRLFRATGQSHRQIARRSRHPRKSRAQSTHRGHHTPPRGRELRGVCARRLDPARRLSGRRRKGRGAVRQTATPRRSDADLLAAYDFSNRAPNARARWEW